MSNQDSDDGANQSPNITDYDDFYELLGVPEDASEQEVMDRSRKLLGKFHPDVSDHPKADPLFKQINRAQEVLTDSEQRTIYDSLGHDTYIKRREEGGEMTLSEDIGAGTDFTPAQNTDDPEVSVDETTSGGMSTDIGSSSRNERNTWAGKIREHGSYKSITEFDMGLSPAESIRKMYREVWVARAVIVLLFGVTAVYLSSEDPGTVMSIWGSIGAPVDLSLGGVVIGMVVAFATFITLVSGVGAYYFLRPVEEELTVESESEREKRERDKERSRGLNTSVDDSRSAAGNNEKGSWDVHSRYDTARENQGVIRTDEKERRNWSLKQGSRLLLIGVVMTLLGAMADGVHPWVYLQSLLGGGGVEAELWWNVGSEGARDVVVLMNAGYAFLMFVFALAGALTTAHGLSREIWYRRYFREQRFLPFIWDTLIVVCGAAIASGLALGTAPIPNVSLPDLPEQAFQYLAISPDVTSLSVALAGLAALFALVVVFRFRRRF